MSYPAIFEVGMAAVVATGTHNVLLKGHKSLKRTLLERGLDPDEVFEECRVEYKKCEEVLRDFSGRNVRVVYPRYNRSIRSRNSSASFSPFLILQNDWTFLSEKVSTEKEKARMILYVVLGHELAHQDHEPGLFKGKFQDYVRELRCDFAGVSFACHCGYERKEAIDAYLPLPTNDEELTMFNKSASDHPSHKSRRYYLEKYNHFCSELIDELADELKYKNKKKIEQLKEEVFRGTIFKKGEF